MTILRRYGAKTLFDREAEDDDRPLDAVGNISSEILSLLALSLDSLRRSFLIGTIAESKQLSRSLRHGLSTTSDRSIDRSMSALSAILPNAKSKNLGDWVGVEQPLPPGRIRSMGKTRLALIGPKPSLAEPDETSPVFLGSSRSRELVYIFRVVWWSRSSS